MDGLQQLKTKEPEKKSWGLVAKENKGTRKKNWGLVAEQNKRKKLESKKRKKQLWSSG